MTKSLIITPGEPAGIGPDIVLMLANAKPEMDFSIVGDRQLMMERAQQLRIAFPANLNIKQVNMPAKSFPGKLNVNNAAYVLECLTQAAQACLRGEYHALVTGPIHKGIINEAGIAFSGHTEFLGELTQSPLPVMLLANNGQVSTAPIDYNHNLRVALLTTHLPLNQVAAAISREKIIQVMTIIHDSLQKRFGIAKPRIAVCGLNPHAGENGYMGREEIDIISPALDFLRQQGLEVQGPLPADTAFIPAVLQNCDVVLAMYHDQGLPVIKAQCFSTAVNVTLGLPIIRTSVDHGSALELAGTGKADYFSLWSAVDMALRLN